MRAVDIWETEYLQVLEGADAVFTFKRIFIVAER
jgi:trans-aconitate methyltransferase